jgi:hypothetical protein
MADFAHVLAAADNAGVTVGAAEAYEQNRRDTAQEVRDGDELVEAIAMLLQTTEGGRWEGFATDLLQSLNGLLGLTRGRTWPKAPNSLSGRLQRLAPSLADGGVRYQTRRDPNSRKQHISLLLSKKEDRSLASLGSPANHREQAEKHASPPDDDRTISERCLAVSRDAVSLVADCPNDERAIPERCAADTYDGSYGVPARVTRDIAAIRIDGSSESLAKGQTLHLASIPGDATAEERQALLGAAETHRGHLCVLIGGEPAFVDRSALQFTAGTASV